MVVVGWFDVVGLPAAAAAAAVCCCVCSGRCVPSAETLRWLLLQTSCCKINTLSTTPSQPASQPAPRPAHRLRPRASCSRSASATKVADNAK